MPESPDPGAANVTQEMFRGALESTFRVVSSDGHVPLRLVEVAEGRSGRGIEQFSLIFHGPADRRLAQGNYEVEHDVLGSMLLFLVPVLESNAERMVYESTFTRPARKS